MYTIVNPLNKIKIQLFNIFETTLYEMELSPTFKGTNSLKLDYYKQMQVRTFPSPPKHPVS